MKPRLLIISSHPIQYQAPWFRELQEDLRVDLTVMFLALPDANDQGVGFGHAFEWDIPLRVGYKSLKAPSAKGSISDGWAGLRLGQAKQDISSLLPDVVMILGWQHLGMAQCILAVSSLGLPLVIRAESNGLCSASWLSQLKNRWLFRGASRFLPIGKANRSFYKQLGVGERLGENAPYFVDNLFFGRLCAEARTRSNQVRESFGISDDAFCFLFVGKFVTKKRPMDLLLALLKLKSKTVKPVHVLMVGTGPLENELRGFVQTNNLPVSFAGFLNQTEIPSAYAIADCLVLPSDCGETWGLVVNEAMACGIPAIVSDRVGCGPDLVEEGVTGFQFEFGNTQELAQKMQIIAQLEPQDWLQLGTTAKTRVLNEYSIDIAVSRTVTAVLALNQKRNPELCN